MKEINWKKIWRVIKTIGLLVGAIAAIFFAAKIRKAIIGKVRNPIKFSPDSKDKTIIHIYDEEKKEFISRKLPKTPEGKQLKSKDIKAAGITKTGQVTVEIKHKVVDRRNVKPIKDSAYDRLKKG